MGVAWYTADYPAAFAGRTFVTLDLDRSRIEPRATRHVVGNVCDVEALFDEPFDVILLNGVIGYGLDERSDVERALRGCAARLRPGGTLVIGVNEQRPTNVDPSSLAAASLFESRPFARWPAGRVTVDLPFREPTHTFLFWRRR